ncbi:cytochrome P450 4V2-like isoform X1 [Colias croceus]|uniref:cytochrome P450 4V2-like isoform X1 n=2 Tax=Colias crocea TaxID=72248 RepID=UPI001E279EB0|nr:cytochrome P450 4V2-like isoform X1 [Colias croceus]
MLWFLIFCFLLFLYIFIKIKWYPGNVAVYPGRWPILGHLNLLSGSRQVRWEKIKSVTRYTIANGDVSVFYMGMFPLYVITDPDDCNTVLSTCMHKPGFMKRVTNHLLGDGLLFGPVSVWKEHRKIVNPTFNQFVLDSFMGIFNDQSRRLVQEWKERVDCGPFDQLNSLEKNTLETICWTTAGVDITGESAFNEDCLKAFRGAITNICDRVKQPWLLSDTLYDKSNLKRNEDYHVGITHELTDMVLRKRREEPSKYSFKSDTKFKPFLHRLLDFDNVLLKEKDIKDEMNNIILTGFETSSSILTYTLVLLGTYPEIQEKCYQEIKEIFDEDRDVLKEDLSRLTYVEAVLKETIRFCTVAPLTARIIAKDVQLKNTVLRKDHICIISLYGVLHHPKWGPDVEEYHPERWLDPARLPNNPNFFGAFGYGRRNCIGKAYGFMTMKVTLAHLLRHFKVSGNYNKMEIINIGINKPGHGHEIEIELRNK